MLSPREQFLKSIEDFISVNEMTPTGFGRAALGDPSFVFELREGRNVGFKTVERVVAFMSEAT